MRGTKDYAPLSLVHFALYGSRKIQLNLAPYESRAILSMKFASCDDNP
ncbi:hypothetical protein LEP1GSC036_1637 [Leptospira weilii str. 2006001853]|nr:hypothetical protein LEP1GSC036_1637 [Leptospira weilii str. 2006001853]EMN42541.1 hypothetical protein LEP1GSC086_1429 [Leptospira weilii str. LNT 1234]